ncbi:hypothetical protein M0802_009494 [Mischocyttarus mexicanus]|nr:hypothetical protein M0802_009494 [Mischocyttarus mexicanus]
MGTSYQTRDIIYYPKLRIPYQTPQVLFVIRKVLKKIKETMTLTTLRDTVGTPVQAWVKPQRHEHHTFSTVFYSFVQFRTYSYACQRCRLTFNSIVLNIMDFLLYIACQHALFGIAFTIEASLASPCGSMSPEAVNNNV